MEAHPARTFWEEARKRERVRCSSLIDWPVYPRLRRIMQGSEGARNSGPRSHKLATADAVSDLTPSGV